MHPQARRTAFTALALAAAAALGLTGCQSGQDTGAKGGDSPAQSATPADPFAGLTGAQIADRALKATTGARSLRMKGNVPDDESSGTITIDIALDRQGSCAGTMGMDGQGKAELIKTGDTLYMKYDEKFLRAQSEGESKADTDATVAMLAGRWTKMSATGQDAKDITSFCDLDSVLGDTEGADSDVTRGETTTVDGTPAVILREKDGAERDTLYVAAEGKPYLLRLDSKSKKDPGTITLSGYDEPVRAEAPKGKVLDLDALDG